MFIPLGEISRRRKRMYGFLPFQHAKLAKNVVVSCEP
jgi:hypothetical protein